MAMPPKVQSSYSCTPKTIIPTINDCEFQTHEPVVCKATRVVVTYMKESKKGKGGDEKQITLRNCGVDASFDNQVVNIKVNM